MVWSARYSRQGIIVYRDCFPAVPKLMEQGYFAKDKRVTKRISVAEIVDEDFKKPGENPRFTDITPTGGQPPTNTQENP